MKRRLTYPNVVATLALFLALGGGAVAAVKLRKNSVGSKQIKPNAAKGVDVDEATFGRVPSADSLDGRDGSEIDRRLRFSASAEVNPDFTNLFTIGAFRFSARCIDDGGSPDLVLQVEDVGGGATKTGSVSTAYRTDHVAGTATVRERFLSLESGSPPADTVLDLDGSVTGTATLGLSAPDHTVTGTLWFDVFDYGPPDETPPDGPVCGLNGTVSLGR